MRKFANHALSGALALALSIALVPGAADAQEAEAKAEAEVKMEKQETCTVELAPAAVQVGQPAVRLIATLGSDIGDVSDIRASEESGIVLAQPAAIPRTETSREVEVEVEADEDEVETETKVETETEVEGEAPQPIVMVTGEEQPTATLWLSTENATPGTHVVVLKGESGKCKTEIEISEEIETDGE